MKNLERNTQAGFTLVELMLSLSIGLLVLTAMIGTFLLQQKIFKTQEHKVEASQTVRAAMNMITQEVMMAGYKPDTANTLQRQDDTLPTFTGVVYDPLHSELEIRADIDDSGDIVEDASDPDPDDWKYNKNERVVYKKIGDQIKRKTGGGYFQPFAENIKAFSFRYLKADGTEAYNESDIRSVEIIIEVESSRYEISGSHTSKRLASLVNLRNMGFEK